jgi:hypothetical protein
MADAKICAVEGCEKPAINSRGWCNAHYLRWLRHGDPLGSRPRVVPNRLVPMEGRRFGLLTVQSRDVSRTGEARWLCSCDCGGRIVATGSNLRRLLTGSCGCLRAETSRSNATKHGHAVPGRETPEYKAWNSAIQRCTNPNSKSYPHYGGRGIKVCERWRHSFENFFADLGPRPSPTHSLDRYPDRKGDYEPGNVRWATQAQQSENRDLAKGADHWATKRKLSKLAGGEQL